MDSLDGFVERITYYNAENGYTVLRLNARGTVSSSPAGINCGSTCTASFGSNTVVTLTAVADTGSAFAGWSGIG